jgi:hypothetical protein
MAFQSGTSAFDFSKSSKRNAKTARRLRSELRITQDFITVVALFAIGLFMSLWLTLQFPIADSTAVFLAQYG